MRAREARPSGGETRNLFDPIHPKAACEPNAADNACKAADPNKTLEILDRIELAKIAGFDPTYIEVGARSEVQIGQGRSATANKTTDPPADATNGTRLGRGNPPELVAAPGAGWASPNAAPPP